MYDHQTRLTIVHSIQDDRMAEARRAHVLREAREARAERMPAAERIRPVAGPVGRVRAALAAMHGHAPVASAGHAR